jgi:hypothetical protein
MAGPSTAPLKLRWAKLPLQFSQRTQLPSSAVPELLIYFKKRFDCIYRRRNVHELVQHEHCRGFGTWVNIVIVKTNRTRWMSLGDTDAENTRSYEPPSYHTNQWIGRQIVSKSAATECKQLCLPPKLSDFEKCPP